MSARRHTHASSRSAVLLCALVLLCSGQNRIQRKIQPQLLAPMRSAPAAVGLTPASDPDAERWLRRAQEAASRTDWKLAIDTLTRVIDQYGDKTVSPDGGHRFYSAIHCAIDQIAAWPAEGLAAYRLLMDGEVQAQFDKARASMDIEVLRSLVRKYPLTTCGPQMTDVLTTWLLDRQEGGEALELLDRLRRQLETQAAPPENSKDSKETSTTGSENSASQDSLRIRLLMKRAVAQMLIGQSAGAKNSLEQLSDLAKHADAATASRLNPQIISISAAINRFSSEKSVAESRSWPQLLGPPGADGRMAAISPAIAPDETSKDTLPGAERLNDVAALRIIENRHRTPVWQMVSDGKSLFVATPNGVMCRDLATFEFVWQAFPKSRPRDITIDRFRRQAMYGNSDSDDRLDRLTTATLFHEFRGAISTSHDLVFMIEQPPIGVELAPNKQGEFIPNNDFMQPVANEPNSLRAFEATTGRAVWTKGRGGIGNDELRLAHFYAPPAACGPHLIAPFQIGEDLYVAVLNTDGTLVKRVLLGAGRPGVFQSNAVLLPTVFESTVYIPTGAGVLVALNRFDYSLRWLATYERAATTQLAQLFNQGGLRQMMGAGAGQADEWLSAPPLIAGNLVLLTPSDGEALIAFDRQSGSISWASRRHSDRCLVGVVGDLIIRSGKTVHATKLADGSDGWRYEGAVPTGRPAICGEFIWVPTARGLVCLNAKTGVPVGDVMASDSPLGNLLAMDGALYSVSSDRIAKYPDIAQSRARAQELLARGGNDLTALLRLAYLSSLDKHWTQTVAFMGRAEQKLATMDKADAESAPAVRSRDHLSHLRVTTYLGLAAESTGQAREDALRRASNAAHRRDDALHAGLALCDHLSEAGKFSEAFKTGVDLLQQYDDVPLALDSGLNVRAAIALQLKLANLWQKATILMRDEWSSDLQRKWSQAFASVDEQETTAVRLADGMSFCDIGARADVMLGRRAADANRNETAAFYFDRARQRSQDSRGAPQKSSPASIELSREATLRLAVVFAPLDGHIPSMPAAAARAIRDLADTASIPAPADLAKLAGLSSSATASDLVTKLASRVPADLQQKDTVLPRILREMSSLVLEDDDVVGAALAPSRGDTAGIWDSTQGDDRFSQIVPLRMLRQIKGCQTRGRSTNNVAWSCELPGDSEEPSFGVGPVAHELQYAVNIGATSIICSDSQVVGVGLQSGRMIWPPITLDHSAAPLPKPAMAAVGNLAVVALDNRTLSCLPVREDAHPLWRRELDAWPIGSLNTIDDAVAVIDRAATRLILLEAATGRARRQFSLLYGDAVAAEDPAADALALVTVVGKTVCRASNQHVVCRDVATGQKLWDLQFENVAQQLKPLDAAHLGVAHGRHYSVVHCPTGKIIRSILPHGLNLPPDDAVLDEGSRLTLWSKTRTDPPDCVLACYPLSDPDHGWQQNLGPVGIVNPRMLRASPRYVAALSYAVRSEQVRAPIAMQMPQRQEIRTEFARLFILDKITGRSLLARPYDFNTEGRLIQTFNGVPDISDVIIFDEKIFAICPMGYYVLVRDEGQLKPSEES